MKKLFTIIFLIHAINLFAQPNKNKIDSATMRDGKTLLNWNGGVSIIRGLVQFPASSGGLSLDANRNLLVGLNPIISSSSVFNMIFADNAQIDGSNNITFAKNIKITGASGTFSTGADHTIHPGADYSTTLSGATLGDGGNTAGYASFSTGFGNYSLNVHGFVAGQNNIQGSFSKTSWIANKYKGGALIGDNLRSEGDYIFSIGTNFNTDKPGIHFGFGAPQFSFLPDGTMRFSKYQYNIGIGDSALKSITETGGYNIGIGRHALINATTAWDNAAIGWDVLYNTTTGSANFAVIEDAGFTNISGSNNIFIGRGAGYFANCSDNNFQGYGAGQNHTIGNENLFIGSYSGQWHTSGAGNTFLGTYSGENSGNSQYSTYIGHMAGFNSPGSNNITLGKFTDVVGNNALNIGNTIYGTGLYTSANKIGIGTKTPQYKLEVAGDVKFNSVILNQTIPATLIVGQIAVDDNYIYVGTNFGVKRVLLSDVGTTINTKN